MTDAGRAAASDTDADAAGNADLREIGGFGYERARDELVNVVKMLEQGGMDLDESLALWERGEALATRCEQHLAGARKRVEDAISRSDAEEQV